MPGGFQCLWVLRVVDADRDLGRCLIWGSFTTEGWESRRQCLGANCSFYSVTVGGNIMEILHDGVMQVGGFNAVWEDPFINPPRPHATLFTWGPLYVAPDKTFCTS